MIMNMYADISQDLHFKDNLLNKNTVPQKLSTTERDNVLVLSHKAHGFASLIRDQFQNYSCDLLTSK